MKIKSRNLEIISTKNMNLTVAVKHIAPVKEVVILQAPFLGSPKRPSILS